MGCGRLSDSALCFIFVSLTRIRLPRNSFVSPTTLGVLITFHPISESQSRQWSGSVEISRDAELALAFCFGSTRCLSLTCELARVTADKKVGRKLVASRQRGEGRRGGAQP